MNLSIRYLIILLFMNVSAASAQQSSATEAGIAAIRAEFKRINAAPLTKEEFKYEADGCVDGGVVTYFRDKQEIVKISESGSIGDGSWVREYYYRSGKFIFCYEVIVGGPAVGPETKTEFRTYVKDDNVLRYMEDKKITPAGDKAAGEEATAYKLVKAHDTGDFAGVLCQ